MATIMEMMRINAEKERADQGEMRCLSRGTGNWCRGARRAPKLMVVMKDGAAHNLAFANERSKRHWVFLRCT